MLNRIIKFSLDNKLFILLAAVLLTVAGIWAGRNTDIDVFPDLTAPTVVVMTDAHGMAPEEVERMVTFPIETAVNGATNVRRVRSTSMQGSSFVFVEFDWGMDQFKARQIVSEKLTTLGEQLPPDVTPVMAPQSSVMGEILFVSLQIKTDSTQQSPASHTTMQDLRTLAEWVIKPAILGTGGVSQVTIIGGDYKQYQIVADPIRMATYGVTMDDVERVGQSLGKNSTGGVVRDYGNEYALRGMARSHDLDELGKSLVKDGVRLYDVADVLVGNAIKQGYASENSSPAIILSVSKQPNINTLKVTEAIEKNLANIEKSFPLDVKMNTHIFRQADFISSSVGNVGRSLVEGAVCVVVVLFLFLGSFRTTLISIVAIPLSLLGTILCIHLMGLEINTMTLGGMCIAIGSLVDDAIIDVENVYKRLRQNHRLPEDERKTAYEVVFKGSSEIRSSIIHATLIIMITFVPLFFLSGLEGRMLKPLGVAYLTALFMSLVVAMTITPLLCKMLLSSDRYLSKNEKESWISRKMSGLYSRMLDWVLRHRTVVVATTGVLLVGAVLLLFTMGRGFLPEFNEGSLTIAAVAKPGISLEESNKIGNLIETQLLDIPEITSTSRRTGRGELDEHSQATNGAEIDVNFKLGKRSKQEFMNDVRARLSTIPGIAVSIGQPLGHRVEHMVSGTQATIAIKIFGNDLSQLYMLGNKIKAATADVEGLVDVNVEQQTEVPQLQLRPDRDKLAHYGISIEEFNHFVELAFGGEKLCEIYEGQRAFDLVVRLKSDNECPTIDDVKDAMIVGQTGAVPMSEVCDVVSCGGPNTISRENVQRKLVVSANVSGRDAMSVVEDIKSVVAKEVTLPEGYRIEYGGQFETAKAASRTLVLVFVLCLLVIYLLLYTEFHNLTLSLIVLLNLPLALIGGVIAVKLSSNLMSIPALIGFITLFGIATRNGILLIAKYQQAAGGIHHSPGNIEAVVKQGSLDRLNPIIMTALTTALSLIPMILAASKAGNEIQAPMAIVVLGGLFSSTLLNIFVVPVVYIWYVNKKQQKTDVA
ncbi:MAG: CusA/CzcA family heavy metal efflux RND transporter [Bacteroidales bacterium]|nr:CusA/CzcA family heavy metal efflux RND transporter [Bacteroidales bacterium]